MNKKKMITTQLQCFSMTAIFLTLSIYFVAIDISVYSYQHTTLMYTHLIQSSHSFGLPPVSLSSLFARDSRSTSSNSRRPMGASSNKAKFSSNLNNDIRKRKIARILRDELSDIICSGDIRANVYPDEALLGSVMITDIELNGDLSIAKVYINVAGNVVERRQIYVWLCDNIGQIRFSLNTRLKSFRRVPLVSFVLADTQSSKYFDSVMDEIALSNKQETGDGTEQDSLFEDMDFEEFEEIDGDANDNEEEFEGEGELDNDDKST